MNTNGKETSKVRHEPNLSIHSIGSLIEPETPPSYGRLQSWDANLSIEGGKEIAAMGPVGIWGPTNGSGSLVSFGNGFQGSSSANPVTSNVSSNSVSSLISSASLASNPPPSTFGSYTHTNNNIKCDNKIDKEFLTSISKVPLSKLTPIIFKLAKDQYGCRFLQKKIDQSTVPNYSNRYENYQIIFQTSYNHIYELIIDPFGNYLVQKLIDYCGESHLTLLLELLQNNIFQISINQHGTRALQKIINSLTTEYQLGLLVKSLRGYIIELIKDLNGNHVIQKILNKYEPEKCQFIYDAIMDDLLIVATHKHGCCVLQKCLNHVNDSQLLQFTQKILAFPTFSRLVNDQYGNYVLQYLVSLNFLPLSHNMYEDFIKFGIVNLCSLKFSSNVMEKFMKNCYSNELKEEGFSQLKHSLIINILNEDLNKLINDPYGNYVIQTLIDILINPEMGENGYNLKYLALLVPSGVDKKMSQQDIQVLVIKNNFASCKIVSSYGKRIQSKISTVMNGYAVRAKNSYSQNKNTKYHNVNSNGDFILSDNFTYGKPYQDVQTNINQKSFYSSNVNNKPRFNTPNYYGHSVKDPSVCTFDTYKMSFNSDNGARSYSKADFVSNYDKLSHMKYHQNGIENHFISADYFNMHDSLGPHDNFNLSDVDRSFKELIIKNNRLGGA